MWAGHRSRQSCSEAWCDGSGLTGPHRRTFATAILAFAHSMLTVLRHPACACQQRRLSGAGQPLTDSAFETVNPNVLRDVFDSRKAQHPANKSNDKLPTGTSCRPVRQRQRLRPPRQEAPDGSPGTPGGWAISDLHGILDRLHARSPPASAGGFYSVMQAVPFRRCLAGSLRPAECRHAGRQPALWTPLKFALQKRL